MLLQYVVSNFKSIGHHIEFSMFPTKENTNELFLKTITTKAGEWKILQRAGFFGPNASGKSSFIESIIFARNYIVEGQKSGKGTKVNQFRGDFKDLDGVSSFQFLFYIEGEVYEYGFSLDKEQVHEEWLMQLTETDLELLFYRTTHKNGKTKIDITERFANNKSKESKLINLLKDSIQENQKNQLFLYKLYDNGIKKVECIIQWFKNLQEIFTYTQVQALPIHLAKDKNLHEYISNKLNDMDTGVNKLSVAKDEIDFYELAQKLELPEKIIDEIEEIKNGIVSLNGKYFIFSGDNKNKTTFLQLKFSHLLNNKEVKFNIEEESDGTKRLVDLLPILFTVGKSKTLYFVDEIDRSLHTKFSMFLLDEFLHRSKTEGYNQIFFTAHDVSLINLDMFCQDEIWFIEKTKEGESVLRPFSDFKVEQGQDPLKAYLSGRFGAVPIIKGVY